MEFAFVHMQDGGGFVAGRLVMARDFGLSVKIVPKHVIN